MRNLRNIAHRRALASSVSPLEIFTWDILSNSLICAFYSRDSDFVDFQRIRPGSIEGEQIATVPAQAGDRIVNLHYLADSSSICAVFEKGDIVLVREDPLDGEEKIEILGSVDEGITAAEWSPDEDMLVICTKVSTALFMTRDFDPLASVEFRPEDKSASKHVSVGWGKAETQFQGKRAKHLRDPTIPETVDTGVLTEFDDKSVTISWRGDGSFVAINTVESDRGRMVRVYSREGSLDSVTEPVDNLEGALSWRPAGNLMAGLQRNEQSAQVVFFERNGLRHGEFPLRLNKDELDTWGKSIKLRWNADSTVLAIQFVDRIQLWKMGNYHYYLKQEIHIGSSAGGSSTSSVLMTWHPERPLLLATCPVSDDMTEFPITFREYSFAVSAGSTGPSSDRGSVAVIDGRTIKFTPLRLANVPPPMALHDVPTPSEGCDVSISQDDRCLAVLLRDSVLTYTWSSDKKPVTLPRESGRYSFSSDEWEPFQVLSLGSDRTIALLQSKIQFEQSAIFDCQSGSIVPVEGPSGPLHSICSIFAGINTEAVFFQTEGGTVYSSANLSDSLIEVTPVCSFPAKVPSVKAVNRSDGQITVFGLLDDGTLYANETRLVLNCTSFAVTSSYLLFTDTRHFLRFVHLSNTGANLVVPTDVSEHDERCRSIERGALLVTVIPSAFSVVLQMPRGNLETIFPRALVLAGIRRCVDAKDYHGAMMACRAQRVDMNLLYDYNPAQFLANVDLFVRQIGSMTNLDLFMSQLRNDDVTTTLYKDTLKIVDSATPTSSSNVADDEDGSSSSKVNKVCSAILEVLNKDQDKNMQNILTAYMCMSPPALESGLAVVARILEKDEDQAQKAAEHVCFLVDPNLLYSASLGMYELFLTVLIAEQTQRDPREYIPFLQGLEEMPELRRKFTIDDHLQRHEKAVTHLFSMNQFDEVAAYVSKHGLYTIALEHYKYQADKLDVIVRLQAEDLASKHQCKAAAVAYESLGDYEMAYKMYKETDYWKETLAAAGLVPLPADELEDLARSVASGLVATKEYRSAAIIYQDYLDDVRGAVDLFCQAHRFSDAIRLASLRHQPDLLTEVVDPGLADGFAHMTDIITDCRTQLNAQVSRLAELRQKKADDPLMYLEGVPTSLADGVDISDNVSVASTNASTVGGGTFMTRYTGTVGARTGQTGGSRQTSKNRRREERKRAKGKKGTVYEEEYLIGSLVRLADRVSQATDEVAVLQDGLVRRRMREQARVIGVNMAALVELCRKGMKESFDDPEGPPAVTTTMMDGYGQEDKPDGGPAPVIMTSGERVLHESLQATAKKRDRPVVKDFKTLVLVDY